MTGTEKKAAYSAAFVIVRSVTAQLSRNERSFRDRLGCFSFRNAFASIWRIRSRVTPPLSQPTHQRFSFPGEAG